MSDVSAWKQQNQVEKSFNFQFRIIFFKRREETVFWCFYSKKIKKVSGVLLEAINQLCRHIHFSAFSSFFCSRLLYPFHLSFCFLSYLHLVFVLSIFLLSFVSVYLFIYIFTFCVIFIDVNFFLCIFFICQLNFSIFYYFSFFFLYLLSYFLGFTPFLSISTSLFFIRLFIYLHVVLSSQFLFSFSLILLVTYLLNPLQTDFFYLTSILYHSSLSIPWGGHLLPGQDLDAISIPFSDIPYSSNDN